MKGPYPVLARGHSGSRLLCEAFMQNDIWMGKVSKKTKDSTEFRMDVPEVYELMRDAFNYDGMSEAEKERARETMRKLVGKVKKHCPNPEDYVAYGWKRGLTMFFTEIFLDAFPEGKVIHLIRDGRDVMLSRLDGRMSRMDDRVNKLMIFGDENATEYNGAPLTSETVEKYRNEIEMKHWVNAMEFGLRGRKFEGRYHEVFYEDLCREPMATLEKVFEFIETPFTEKARAWIKENAYAGRIGKWKNYNGELTAAMTIGEPMLKKLGYI